MMIDFELIKKDLENLSVYWNQYKSNYEKNFIDMQNNKVHIPECDITIECKSYIHKSQYSYRYVSKYIDIIVEYNSKLSINEIINLVIISNMKSIFPHINMGKQNSFKEYNDYYVQSFIEAFKKTFNPEYIYIDKIEEEKYYFINYKLSQDYLDNHSFEDYNRIINNMQYANNDSTAFIYLDGNGDYEKNFKKIS